MYFATVASQTSMLVRIPLSRSSPAMCSGPPDLRALIRTAVYFGIANSLSVREVQRHHDDRTLDIDELMRHS
jgi:hypothetical protein